MNDKRAIKAEICQIPPQEILSFAIARAHSTVIEHKISAISTEYQAAVLDRIINYISVKSTK